MSSEYTASYNGAEFRRTPPQAAPSEITAAFYVFFYSTPTKRVSAQNNTHPQLTQAQQGNTNTAPKDTQSTK